MIPVARRVGEVKYGVKTRNFELGRPRVVGGTVRKMFRANDKARRKFN